MSSTKLTLFMPPNFLSLNTPMPNEVRHHNQTLDGMKKLLAGSHLTEEVTTCG